MKAPFANSSVAEYITRRISVLEATKTQSKIAQESGFLNPSMLSMIKHGKERLPLRRVPALALALGVDAPELYRLAMEQYWSDKEIIAEIFSNPINEYEVEIIEIYREATANSNPPLSPEIERRLIEMFETNSEAKEA